MPGNNQPRHERDENEPEAVQREEENGGQDFS